ncbi:MAG: hypothetical protein K2K87_11970 [Lachnospiraceae bacterium]|nr:hypothetical protein [Lachnospiraceae bacterium]
MTVPKDYAMLKEVTVTPADAAVGNKEQEACNIISVDKNRIGWHGAGKILRAVSYLQENCRMLETIYVRS